MPKNAPRVLVPLAVGLAILTTPVSLASADGLTFMHEFVDLVQVEFKAPGTGIHGTGPVGDSCPQSIFGVRAITPIAFHGDGRVSTNLKAGSTHVSGLGTIPLTVPCPLPGSNNEPLGLTIADMNLHLASETTSVFQDVCTEEPFWECVIDQGTADLDLYACPVQASSFNSGAFDDRGTLGGTVIQGSTFSRELECSSPASRSFQYTGDPQYGFFFDPERWGSDAQSYFQYHDVVRYGDGSHYVAACMEVSYDYFDLTTLTTGSGSANAHDWRLVLDLGTPEDWADALALHLLGINGDGRIVEGWSDTGGFNGCPFSETMASPPTKKADDIDSQTMELVNALTA